MTKNGLFIFTYIYLKYYPQKSLFFSTPVYRFGLDLIYGNKNNTSYGCFFYLEESF